MKKPRGGPSTPVRRTVWPHVPGPQEAALRALLFQLTHSQWWTPERLREQQLRQAGLLLAHAAAAVPFYAGRLSAAGFVPGRPLDEATWRRLPVLSRIDLQEAGDALRARTLDAFHQPVNPISTSGSTGRRVTVLTTPLTRLMWTALTQREHEWHGRDGEAKLAAIRFDHQGLAAWPDGRAAPTWGLPPEMELQCGPAALLSIETPVDRQLDWLVRQHPAYIITYPSNLQDLAKLSLEKGIRLDGLRSVQTLSEALRPGLRDLCRAAWGVPLVDIYSAQEVGYIALQCPEHEHYHVQSESLLVEILDDDDRPCPPGRAGRVVVTTLLNFASPLIRYAIGDYAEAGPPCSCGRGLPVLAGILGRQRAMLTLPGGARFWPFLGDSKFDPAVRVRQFQVVQKTEQRLEVRLAVDAPVTAEQEDGLRKVIRERLGYAYDIDFAYCDAIPRGPGGKYHDFISEISA